MLFDFDCMLSISTIHFDDKFCTSKKGGMGGSGWVSGWGAVHMATALTGCRITSVDTGWTISYLVSTNGCRNHYSSFLGAPFLDL